MRLPDDFLDIVTASKLRSLQSDQPAVIEIQSIAGADSDASKLKLDWEITGFSESGLDFKLVFADPLDVSQNDEPDTVKVKLNLTQFTDEYG